MHIALEIIMYVFSFIGIIFTILAFFKTLLPNEYEKFTSKASIFFARFTKRAEKAAVSRDIQSNMNSTVRKLNEEFELPELTKVEVRWVDNERKVDAFIKSGEKLILAMEYHHNQDKNILNAARLYVSRCVTNTLKNYSETELKEAVDLTLIRRFLEKEEYEATLRYFFDESFDFEQTLKEKIIDYYNEMLKMQKRGVFTVIYLNELLRVGKVVYPATKWENVKDELNKFTDFMITIANKQRGVDLEVLSFKDDNIKMGIIMIGKEYTIDNSGIESYRDWALKYAQEGIDKIYILSSDWKKALAKDLLEQLKKSIDIKKSKIREYCSEEYPDSICVYLSLKET